MWAEACVITEYIRGWRTEVTTAKRFADQARALKKIILDNCFVKQSPVQKPMGAENYTIENENELGTFVVRTGMQEKRKRRKPNEEGGMEEQASKREREDGRQIQRAISVGTADWACNSRIVHGKVNAPDR